MTQLDPTLTPRPVVAPVLPRSRPGPVGLAVRIIAIVVAVGIALALLFVLRSIVLQVIVAVILATGIGPMVDRLQRRGMPRALSVLLIYLGIIGLIVLFGVAVIPPILIQIEELIHEAPRIAERTLLFLADLRERFPFLPPLDEQLEAQLRGIGSQVGLLAAQALFVARFALGVFGGLLAAVLVLLITLYLTVDGVRIREYFLSFLEPERRPQVRLVMDRMGTRMGGWLIGQITLSVTVGVISYIGLLAIGVPGPVLLAVVAGVGEAIPIMGPIVAAVPAIIVALTISPVHALFTLLLYVIIQQLENNLLVPKIMERAVNLHPLAVVLSLLAGTELLGIMGAIVAVPVAAAVAVVLEEVRIERRRAEVVAGTSSALRP